ncbi:MULTISPECIES: AAA family ATPase [unclassified Microcoleus]|uniref:AAA family ATPase n=1 Tax=unclassified Microcoleus TaxID=2642155 RepID=UPI002FD02A3E
MIEINGYQILTQIYESTNSTIYRGIRQQDNQAVILKFLKEDYPTPSELVRYKQEYEITRNLNIDGVIKAYELKPYQMTLCIILEDFGASSLKQLMDERRESGTGVLPLQKFLSIAIKTAEILSSIHAANIVHKDINPANIIFNPEIRQLKIIDFGISTKFTRENPTLKNPNVLEGTLAYISPEQTGRMNRSLDYRTDFYSLGVTFYELLTGKLPFETNDALELVHCHIAKVPICPHQVNPEIPKPVSDIVMKLMAKTAEERYQSGFGIKNDLAECLHQLQTTGNISDFSLGTQDISDQFQIPQKLYGREAEVEALLTAFERVGDNPQSKIEMMLIAGYSGIGKSSLVAEIHKPNTRLRGYFTAGKFDQFQKSLPYSAVVSAFKGLVRQLLTESEIQLEQWREKLRDAFGVNGQVIIDVIPEVELIVGKQPPVPELGATESQNRFNIVLGNFIRAFCTKEHPLVIFLDDLQWADSATLKLIELMMTDADMQYLFLIGAYRDNEVSPTHPLIMTLDGLLKEGATINYITLAPLELENISQLIADTLYSDNKSVESLAELVMKKTGGNPFFVNQFLKTLHAEKLISFDVQQQSWQWNIAQIEAQNITDNVVELMIYKLKKLPPITQQVLRLASCIGASFYLSTLSIVCEEPPEVIFSDLLAAIQTGFILPASEFDENLLIQDYKFLHDRVQQAAYSLICENEKKAVHLKIGRLLQVNTPVTERDAKIFDIVEHFNLGRELITDQTEKIALAKFNLIAARKAKDSTAYLAAREYLTIGISLLSGDFWQEEYQLTLQLHKEKAEIEYLNSNFDYAEELIYLVIERCKNKLEKAEVYNLLIVMLTMMSKHEKAITAARQALNLLGIELTDKDFTTALQKELAEVRKLWQPGEISTLQEQPEMTSLEMRAALTLLVSADPPAYFSNPELYGIIAAKMASICIKYGAIAASAKAYTSYGLTLSSVLQEYRSGYEFARLGFNISKRFNDSSMKAKAANNMANHIQHWVLPIKEAEAINNEGYQAGLESGELQFAGYITFHQMLNFFVSGKNLLEILALLNDYLKFTAKTKNLLAYHTILASQLFIYNLSGLSPKPREFASESLNEADYIEDCQTHQNFFALGNYLTYKAQVLYLYGDNVIALHCIQEAQTMLPYVQGMITNAVNNFYNSLILLAVYPTVSKSEQISYQKQIETNQQQMKIWADNCPENFLHKYLLVEAEIARISGKEMEAIDLYDRAISSANENEYIQNEALGNELVAKFWLGKSQNEIAKLYMKKAHYGYQLWGAKRKVEDLEQKYPQLISKVSAKKQIDLQTTARGTAYSTTGGNLNIDLSTVIKASQVLAGEIASNKLLEKLMTILLENGGAQKGFIVLSNKDNLTIEARGEVDNEQVEVGQSISIEGSENLPVGMIKYVARTQEDVVLSEATKEGVFTSEPYIIKNQPKSVLCAPIINQGKLLGILYLENNLTTGAFTRDRLEILKVLSSQAAISIENALLYRTLEDKVQERTAQLAEANQEISTLNQKLKAENIRMSAELDIVKQLQQMVLPKQSEFAAIEGLEIAGFMEPADEVGGDYYDVLQQDGQVKISIGDVTGHGLESGVLMIMAQTAVRTLQKINETDPVKFLDVLNQTLYDNLQRMDSSRNMSLAILDYAGGVLKLSGQHEEMIVVRADGKLECIDTMDLGFPIGLVEEIGEFIAQAEVQLNPGDVVVLYTDGIPEAFDINKGQYGLKRLWQVVVENRHRCAQEIREVVINDVRQYIGAQKVFDDITLVVMKQK